MAFCPLMRYKCAEESCGLWSEDFDSCSFKLIGESLGDIAFAADNSNLDCAIRVRVTKEDSKHNA